MFTYTGGLTSIWLDFFLIAMLCSETLFARGLQLKSMKDIKERVNMIYRGKRNSNTSLLD